MKLNRTLPVLAALVSLILLATPTAAVAEETPISPEVADALEVEPGGVVIDYWTAEWPDTGMRLDVEPEIFLRAAVGSCASGRICAFSKVGATGTKLSWSSCGTYSTSALGSAVRSIANARSTGTLKALNGSTTVASASAGTSTNVYATVTKVSC